MKLTPIALTLLTPPQADLLAAIQQSSLMLSEGDVVAVSTKVVSIWKGRCVRKEGVDVESLIASESEQYLDRALTPGGYVVHTLTQGSIIPNAGIDPLGEYYVLWPKDPSQTAEELLAWLKEAYGVQKLGVILTDSRSMFLRRGVVGFAVAWAGFNPLFDNRLRKDVLGEDTAGSQTNVADALAASAVFVMGEANELTPLVRIEDAPYVWDENVARKAEHSSFTFAMSEDIFAPFMNRLPWKKGGLS